MWNQFLWCTQFILVGPHISNDPKGCKSVHLLEWGYILQNLSDEKIKSIYFHGNFWHLLCCSLSHLLYATVGAWCSSFGGRTDIISWEFLLLFQKPKASIFKPKMGSSKLFKLKVSFSFFTNTSLAWTFIVRCLYHWITNKLEKFEKGLLTLHTQN